MARELKFGTVFRVPLPNGASGYGVVLSDPLMAFFGRVFREPPSIEELIKERILFKTWVDSEAIKLGRWPVIGEVELPESMMEPVMFFKQDVISGDLSIFCYDPRTRQNSPERDATYEECETLERNAVWHSDHIESRLQDHGEGNPNIYVESLKPKRPRGLNGS